MDYSMTRRIRKNRIGRGLTFEKVWAVIEKNAEEAREWHKEIVELQKETDRKMQETSLQMKETDRMMKETDRMMQETDREMRETDRKMKETDRKMQETDRRMQETSRKMEMLNEQMGGLHRSFGEMAEHLVAPSIEKRFNELGYHFNAVAPGGYKVHDDMGKVIAEVDLLLENGDCIMAVEVKAKAHTKDIEHHVKRMELLRKHWNKRGDKRVIQGALAGAIFGSIEKQAAIEAGLYVLVQSGDTMKLELPEGFVPGEW